MWNPKWKMENGKRATFLTWAVLNCTNAITVALLVKVLTSVPLFARNVEGQIGVYLIQIN